MDFRGDLEYGFRGGLGGGLGQLEVDIRGVFI
jgi:hypothetical protein